MDANETMVANETMIIGELHGNFFCISTRPGSLRRMGMHAPVPVRARFFEELFYEGPDILRRAVGKATDAPVFVERSA